ncbi:MAG TPA: RNA polymerase sigma factor [Anaerolineales bacterium]|nr:RNA polymerase sigma factor [Anaerolineales bacterium]
MAPAEQVGLWVDRHGQEIHAYLWRFLGDAQDAEDALQETFLRALRYRGRPVAEPRAWLYAVAGNVARSQLRRRQRDEARFSHLDDETPAPETTGGRDLWVSVRRVVEALPVKQRQALLLRRYQGLSYGEIARAVGGSAESARANVYQAVRRLRAAFPEEVR